MRVEITFLTGCVKSISNVNRIVTAKTLNENNIVWYFYHNADNWESVYSSDVRYVDITEPTPSWNNQNYVN